MEKDKARWFWQSCRELTKKKNELAPYESVVRDSLRSWAEADGQNTIAKIIGFTPQYINDVLHERRAITAGFLAAVKEKVTW